MANVVINDTNLAELAKVIRLINGETTTYTIEELAPAILALPEPPGPLELITWADLYNVCVKKANGENIEWPLGVEYGQTKTVVDTSTGDTCLARLIGIEIDGPGVLTFQQITPMASAAGVNRYGLAWSNEKHFNTDAYITIPTKITAYPYDLNVKEYSASNTYWLLSSAEMADSHSMRYNGSTTTVNWEYTDGVNVPYPYFEPRYPAAKRKVYDANGKSIAYNLRSYGTYVDKNGYLTNEKPEDYVLYTCFCIGK